MARWPATHLERIAVIDSHTAGEPTRVVVDAPIDLGRGSMSERLETLRRDFDWLRSAVVNEPRGSDVFVGALLCPPVDPGAATGVIFFNNVGYLGMCGHGAIGVAATLRHLGRLGPGRHRLETPVGNVRIELAPTGAIAVENVPSYRFRRDASIAVPGVGTVTGDVAWGGNWFFLLREHGQELRLDRVAALTAFAQRVRDALDASDVRGRDGTLIDHVELFGPPRRAGARSRNFVLCPGGAYDRSPCGTGTSAKIACLAEDGSLAEGEPWVQESIVGTTFTASYRRDDRGEVVPTIVGEAHVNAEITILLDPRDPFATGIGREAHAGLRTEARP